MENTRVFVNKTGVLKNTRVFFVKYPGIFQYPGKMTLHRAYFGLYGALSASKTRKGKSKNFAVQP